MNVASIDIGTNTVILLIAKINKSEKKITPLLNEYQIPRLGRGLESGKPLPADNLSNLLKVFDHYSELIKQYRCELVFACGTSAMRRASNSKEIAALIKKRYGIEIRVISGEEEARLSYLGAVSAVSNERYTIIDIGGGSTEIISGTSGKIDYKKSFEAGVVRLTEKYLRHDPPGTLEIEALERELANAFTGLDNTWSKGNLISLAGTPTTLSCIKAGLKEYDEESIEGSVLSRSDLRSFISLLSGMTVIDITDKFGKVVEGRADLILCGAAILYHLMRTMDFELTTVSSKGLRYGAVIDYLTRS